MVTQILIEIEDIPMDVISYVRVSTKKQGISGLGLEGQREAVELFRDRRKATILAEYLEVETGKRKDRPELTRALAHCKRTKATLVVAKLDRLARSVAFTSALMESKVPFVCTDNRVLSVSVYESLSGGWYR
jgi:DNA invertase Pin-like site-specific DNA recombinase